MKELILVRGLSGSGKTTAAKVFAENWPVLSNDDWFESREKYEFTWEEWEDAKRFCFGNVERLMLHKTEKVYVANTFSKEEQMKPYFKLAERYGYRVFSIIVENRHGNKNVHNVPDKIIDDMNNYFEVKLK